MTNKTIAVIPARGGSKRIPRKNIRDFCGKPMIAWSIEVARSSGLFDHVIVSTDDSEIADIAIQYEAEVPFIRPVELADDYTGTTPIIAHAIDWVNLNIGKVDYACCIYATAPFVQAEELQIGRDLLKQSGADYTFSATSYAFPIQRAIRITDEQRVEMFYPEHFNTRSQDLEEAYHDAGQFYWGRSDAWLAGKPLFAKCAAPVLLPRNRVQDIDTVEDWERAEWLFKAMSARETK
ncbi:N-acylneuraminate cytidylyltransferase [Methylophilus rhizosphaerae]|uniref:N-acylneuraminate cytidylyltransferase n=1 Tax=Methylophilus rhizosphaerae TaxID=492660 RepID=A0A1G8ZCK8_9PROT|nr:pseudaminic acid cytidylyltransferase [Methylophilus rhizosphaerae]SDK11900.1 N-acylneuraminate cytidylyltransferase [Methylophilus rhizosphaerae]